MRSIPESRMLIWVKNLSYVYRKAIKCTTVPCNWHVGLRTVAFSSHEELHLEPHVLFVILRVGNRRKNKVSHQGCQAKFAVTLINIQANVFQTLLWITFPSFLPLLQSSCWLRIFTFVSDLSCLHFIAYDCYCLCLFYPLHCVSFS